MSNVPHHSSTRDHGHHDGGSSGGGHHSASSRSSHRHSGFLPALGGGDEAAEQWAKDGVVEPGGIAPGTVHGAALVPGTVSITPFADDIRPVAIVDTLPTLPDPLYPEFSYVVLTSDERLYKNIADVWVKGVDGADIVADSITAGQIAAGAIGATEIAAEAITADELQVGLIPGRNFLVNGGFRDGTTGWTFDGNGAPGATFTMWAVTDSSWVLRDGDVDSWTPTGTNYGSTAKLFGTNTASIFLPRIEQKVPVAPGEYYSASILLARHRLTDASIRVNFLDRFSVVIGSTFEAFCPASPTGGPERDDWNYVVINGMLAPATAHSARIRIIAETPNTSGSDWYLMMDQAWFGGGRTARPFVPGEPSGLHNSDGNVLINESGITVTNGSITVSNPGATVIIDGTSDMFLIAATGTHANPSGTTTSVAANLPHNAITNTDVSTGFSYIPAILSYLDAAGVGFPTPTLTMTPAQAFTTVQRYWHQEALVNSGNTRIRCQQDVWLTSASVSANTFRYYILKQVGF